MNRNVLWIILAAVIAAAFSGCGGTSGEQGNWYGFTYSYYAGDELKEESTRIRVTDCTYGEGMNDEIQLRVEYSVENQGKEPIRITWEDKYILDPTGGMHEPFDGNSVDNMKHRQGIDELYVRYRLPRYVIGSGAIERLQWGLHAEDEAGLKWKIRLKPKSSQR